MAEIRSTMEMVLERAAKMEKEAAGSSSADDKEKQGMRMAAKFLRGEEDLSSFASLPEQDRQTVKKGIILVLLRNIVLPREVGENSSSQKAMEGLLVLHPGPNDLNQVFSEMKSILDRFLDHKKQLRGQLEEQFAQQMEMMEQNLSQQTGVRMNLQPSQHPKFAEEWQKIQIELKEQYGRALAQYKDLIEQRLAG